MKADWTYTTLGDVCNVINGLWIGKKAPFINIAVIRNTNFSKDCKLKLDNVAYIDVEIKQFSTRKLEYGDIIIEKSGGSEKQPVGRAILFDIADGNYSFSNFTAALRIKEKKIDPKFLYRCLYAHYVKGETLKMQSKTTGLHNLDMKTYLRLPIPILPLAEQERIVSELDLLSGIIDKQKAQLKELDNLAQSIFYDMFGDPVENEKGWEIKKIKDVFNVKIGPFGSLLHNNEYVTGGVPLVNPIHMQNEKIIPDVDFTVSDVKLESLSNYILHTNDIVLARRGDIGRCAIVGKKEDGYLCGTGSLYIRPISPINSTFAIKMIRCKSMINHLVSLAKGATMLNINCKIIEELNIITPPSAFQQHFAEKIEHIEKQKEAITRSIADTQQLFDSRMAYWFD